MSSALTIFIAYTLGTLSLVCDFFDPYSGIFGALFKFVVLFITGTSLINVYARKDTLANTSEHNYYSYLESHGIMKEQTSRAASLAVYKSMLGLVRLCSALTVACSIGLNGTLTLMVVIYPTDFPVTRQLPWQQSGGHIPAHRRPGHVHRLGHLLLEGRLPTQPKRNGPTLGMFAHCERLMSTVPSQAHHR